MLNNLFSKIFITFLITHLSFSQDAIVLDKKLLEAEIVLLGEQTHGDGAVFDEKVKIIKELHKNYNFNFIVFESGLYDNFKAHQLYTSNLEDITIYRQSIFDMWSGTTAFQDLLEYLKNNPKLKLLGFDSQEFSLFKTYYLEDLKHTLSKYSISISDTTYFEIEKVLIYKDFNNYLNDEEKFNTLLLNFKNVYSQLKLIENKTLAEKVIQQTFNSSLADLIYSYDYQSGKKVVIQNPRDQQMAENLIFLKAQFPNEKFMAWGASYHFANEISTFEYTDITEHYIKKHHKKEKQIISHNEMELSEQINDIKALKGAIPMGQILKDKYGAKLYSLAFTSYQGTYLGQHDKIFSILDHPENSIETSLFLQNTGKTLYTLNDISAEKKYASVLGYLPLFANWETIFDGIYYIPTMYPPQYIAYATSTLNNKKVNYSSNVIEGQVFDNNTNLPIQYIDVYYRNSNKSVVTNSNGKYGIERSTKNSKFLYFSGLGYLTDSINLNSLNSYQKLYLRPIETLDEVLIQGKIKTLSAEDIVKKARKNIETNYIQAPYNQAFLYEINNFNTKDQLTFNEKAIIQTYNKKGINGSNNVENNFYADILHLKNTTNNYSDDKWSGIGNLWVTLNRDIILSKANVLYRTSSYELTKEGLIDYDGKKVYKISFINKSPGTYSTGYGYPAPESSSGFIYIDKNSFAVLKYEHCISREMRTPKRSKYKQQNFINIVQTYKEVKGLYFINLMEINSKTDYYNQEDNYLGRTHSKTSLTSQDIETDTLSLIERPIVNLKRGFKYDENDTYWLTREIDLEKLPETFNCNAKTN